MGKDEGLGGLGDHGRTVLEGAVVSQQAVEQFEPEDVRESVDSVDSFLDHVDADVEMAQEFAARGVVDHKSLAQLIEFSDVVQENGGEHEIAVDILEYLARGDGQPGHLEAVRHETSRKRVVPFLAGGGAAESRDESFIAQKCLTELGEVGLLNRLDHAAEFGELLGGVPGCGGQIVETVLAVPKRQDPFDANLEPALVAGYGAADAHDVAQLELPRDGNRVVPQDAADLAGPVFEDHSEELSASLLLAEILPNRHEIIVDHVALLEGLHELLLVVRCHSRDRVQGAEVLLQMRVLLSRLCRQDRTTGRTTMGKPVTAMLITRQMQEMCFSDVDLARIAAVTELRKAQADEMTEDVKQAAIAGAEIMVTGWGTDSLEPAVLDAAPGLRIMFHTAGSIKHLVSPDFPARGIRVCSARYALASGVAEFAFGMMLVSMKAAWQCHAMTSAGQWQRDGIINAIREPCGATVGLVGGSCVGRQMIPWCKMLDLEALLLYDPYVSGEEAASWGVEKVELDDLMRRSDVVSLHTPDTDECEHVINADNLALMRDGAIFINTARGRCVDEDALIAELEKGRLWACLDVTHPEPPVADSPLYALPNCVLTPHVAGSVKQNCHRQGKLVAGQIESYVNGENIFEEIDLSQLGRFA